eukprot:12911588-Prorocentrum_lima.AAC.1
MTSQGKRKTLLFLACVRSRLRVRQRLLPECQSAVDTLRSRVLGRWQNRHKWSCNTRVHC